ncbi:hypothetical protein SLEP1_g58312 [Rubroshorea leprosula]|uniref:Uncharacterized protein n=1 Tax=Rubroshorea leprosula TaxID=152421 RepID=A0AAV5MNV5_9ROSI|nr:hypothetical protein SLEP1_g58312 [Rubroshorea leprosula]
MADKPLLEYALGPVEQAKWCLPIASYWGEDNQWKWEEFPSILPFLMKWCKKVQLFTLLRRTMLKIQFI